MSRVMISMIAALAAVAAVVCGCSSWNALSKDEAEALDTVMKRYYKSPDPGYMISCLPRMKATLSNWGQGAVFALSGFYYGAARKATGAERDAWARAAETCGVEGLAFVIDKGLAGEELQFFGPDHLEDFAPAILDFCWGYFFATGDEDTVRLLIRRGSMTVPEPKAGQTIVDLTARAAQWSLLANAGSDEKVRAELENFALSADAKSLTTFFGTKPLDEHVRGILSADAVMRIESIVPEEGKQQ